MPRQKSQRPTVYATGKREKLWKAEWRDYYTDGNGIQKFHHRSKTWSRAKYTKAEAQAECDKLMRELQQGGPKADGSMTLESFWSEIYHPIRSRGWALNTQKSVRSLWNLHICPAFGHKRLMDITKADIELHLCKLADEGLCKDIVVAARMRLHAVLEEAVDNDFILNNPARKAAVPECKATPGVRSLTVDEVQRLWESTTGKDYLLWRILLLTGIRIGEALALTRSDLLPDGIRIDESALNAKPSTTKNKRIRVAPIPASLRSELEEWLESRECDLIFTTPTGLMHRRGDAHIEGIVHRAQKATGITDLAFRQCRTTFATLFEGDVRDAQEILGHHSAAFTLQRYRKPVTERQQRSVDELDRRLTVVSIREAS